MKLQVALDNIKIRDAIDLLKEIACLTDIVEIGTPLIMENGLESVKIIKREFPRLPLLADLKIMDAGGLEAGMAFEAGADIVTVLGVSHDATIKAVVDAAGCHGGKVMADMICVKDLEQRAKEIDKSGVDFICVHTAFDVHSRGGNPLEDLGKVGRVVKKAGTALAGGIKLENFMAAISERPEIIIVGGGITGQRDKKGTAKAMKEMMGHH